MTDNISILKKKKVLIKDQFPVIASAFTYNGNNLFSITAKKSVHIWNHHDGKHITEYRTIHRKQPNDIIVNKSTNFFVTCGADGIAVLVDIVSQKHFRKYLNHNGGMNCCQLSANSNILLTGCSDKTVLLWDLNGYNPFRPVQTLNDASDSISGIIITSSIDGYCRYYDIRKGQLSIDYMKGDITSDYECCCINTFNESVILIDVHSGVQLNTFTGIKNKQYPLNSQFLHDNSYVASSSEDGYIYVWSLTQKNGFYQDNQDCISTIKTDSQKKNLVSCHHNGSMVVWEIKDLH